MPTFASAFSGLKDVVWSLASFCLLYANSLLLPTGESAVSLHISKFAGFHTNCFRADKSGQFDEKNPTGIVHLWLVNTAVAPRTYVHVPTVLDTGYEGELSLPLREVQKLKLERDTFIPVESYQDASGHIFPMVTYNAVLTLVPMLNKPEGSLDFFKSGRLHPTSSLQDLPDQGHFQAAEDSDQATEAAGQAVIALENIKDKSDAWVQLSPVKHQVTMAATWSNRSLVWQEWIGSASIWIGRSGLSGHFACATLSGQMIGQNDSASSL